MDEERDAAMTTSGPGPGPGPMTGQRTSRASRTAGRFGSTASASRTSRRTRRSRTWSPSWRASTICRTALVPRRDDLHRPGDRQRISVAGYCRAAAEDSHRKRRNSELWNELTWGQLGRSPDILAPYIISALPLEDAFSAVKNPNCDFGENLENYYQYCKTTTCSSPMRWATRRSTAARSRRTSARLPEEEAEVALHVVEETR